MIWKFLKQIVLFSKGLNWVQQLVSRIGLLSFSVWVPAYVVFVALFLIKSSAFQGNVRNNIKNCFAS